MSDDHTTNSIGAPECSPSPAGAVVGKKARQQELRRARNRRAQTRFRQKVKVQQEEWTSELENLRHEVGVLREEKQSWEREKSRLQALARVKEPAAGPLDLALLSPPTKSPGPNGQLNYFELPACMELLKLMYKDGHLMPIKDLLAVTASELVQVRKDLVHIMQHLSESGQHAELQEVADKFIRQVRQFYKTSGFRMDNIYWRQHQVESGHAEVRRWANLVATMGLTLQQQERIREAAARRHMWICYLVDERRATGHDFLGLDADFLEQVFSCGTFSKAITLLGHMDGIVHALLNVQVEFLAEVCQIATKMQVAMAALHNFETMGTVMLHVPGVGVLDEVLAQSRLREQLDCVEAFLDRVPDIDCTSGPMPGPLALPGPSSSAAQPDCPASLATRMPVPMPRWSAQQRCPQAEWYSPDSP